MNNKRRKQIQLIVQRAERIIDMLTALRDDTEEILNDEIDAFESMPESLQESDRGQNSQDAQDSLSDAIDALDEAISCLEEVE